VEWLLKQPKKKPKTKKSTCTWGCKQEKTINLSPQAGDNIKLCSLSQAKNKRTINLYSTSKKNKQNNGGKSPLVKKSTINMCSILQLQARRNNNGGLLVEKTINLCSLSSCKKKINLLVRRQVTLQVGETIILQHADKKLFTYACGCKQKHTTNMSLQARETNNQPV